MTTCQKSLIITTCHIVEKSEWRGLYFSFEFYLSCISLVVRRVFFFRYEQILMKSSSRVDNVRHTSRYFFIENFIMAEIFQPSNKRKLIFSSPDPKGHVSYSHHLASVVVVRRPSYVVNFFKNLLL